MVQLNLFSRREHALDLLLQHGFVFLRLPQAVTIDVSLLFILTMPNHQIVTLVFELEQLGEKLKLLNHVFLGLPSLLACA